MKKRPAIGVISVVIAFSVIIGIASIPDEVLIESSTAGNSKTTSQDSKFSPNKMDSMDNLPKIQDQMQNDNAKAELAALKNEIKELKNELVDFINESQPSQEVSKYSDTSNNSDRTNSDTNVIKINIKDGVGTKER